MRAYPDLKFLDQSPVDVSPTPPQALPEPETYSQGQAVVQISDQQQQMQKDHAEQKFLGGHGDDD